MAAPNGHAETVGEHLQGDAGFVDGDLYAQLNGIDNTNILKGQHKVSRGHRRVIQVGTGVAGIAQAATLLQNKTLRPEELIIFDVLKEFGGVWAKNTYPGCACDVPALMYTNRMMISTQYTHVFATGPQIKNFYVQMAHRYGLERCTQFQTYVRSCTWDESNFLWHVETENQATGNIELWTADVVIHAIGSFDRPKFGGIPGLDSFKGQWTHTGTWKKDFDWVGKRVAVVGCGPSAAQVIPEIVDQCKHLTVYMRTPPAVLPRGDAKHSSVFMWCLKYLPYFAVYMRFLEIVKGWLFGPLIIKRGSWLNKLLDKKAREFLEKQISDPKLREKLNREYEFFCNRPLLLDNFYPALAKPNCTVLREQVTRYTETGIEARDLKTGEKSFHEFDSIIVGTGYNTSRFLSHEKITGVDGTDLQQHWKQYCSTLHAVATYDFPNFFFCNGPNANTFSSSYHDVNESTSRFIAKCVATIVGKKSRGVKFAMMPKPEREREYQDMVQRSLSDTTIQYRGCANHSMKDSNHHNTALTGEHVLAIAWKFRKINWKEWDTIEKPKTEI
ncbi:hypothetical protein AYO20_11079 [Fonsecaea nubica]|uniref:FAD/NAD(P)-binding domain-containing protein n=1 Tax=Fonsecaea nubica TaxID=856822 RepID=A0A178BZM1_9EURO|nr:hypothetical protein AYO20_11079 [Fonsecaea nubica]OAL23088.1 hypothetical protein AYO20_11079 [Fonsecaea nubica]